MVAISFVLIIFAALATCIGPKKSRFDVFGLAQTTKTLSLELSNEGGEKMVIQGNVTDISKDARKMTGFLWQDLSALEKTEGEEHVDAVQHIQPVFAPRLWKFESANATSYAVYTAPIPEPVARSEQSNSEDGSSRVVEPAIVWTKLIDTKLGEKWSVPMEYFDQHGRKLIVRLLNSVSVEVTIIPPAAETKENEDGSITEAMTSTLRIVRTTNIKKQGMLQSMLMPLLTMVPMQIMQMRQRKKMAAEQAQAAQQGGAAPTPSTSEQSPQNGETGTRSNTSGTTNSVNASHAPEREDENNDAADTAVAAGATEASSSADEIVE